MTDQQERTFVPTDEVAPREGAVPAVESETAAASPEALPNLAQPTGDVSVVSASDGAPAVEVEAAGGARAEGLNGVDEDRRWHAQAGRKGARRVHQLIQEGRLYEQEHGLKRGRQRLRQLIELGKLYEQEHGLRPAGPQRRGERLSRVGREELLGTLLQCLLRIAKPSFRAELVQLVQALAKEGDSNAA